MEIRTNLQKPTSECLVNSGFPEFSERPEFHQAPPRAMETDWLDSELLSPEIRRLMKGICGIEKA